METVQYSYNMYIDFMVDKYNDGDYSYKLNEIREVQDLLRYIREVQDL